MLYTPSLFNTFFSKYVLIHGICSLSYISAFIYSFSYDTTVVFIHILVLSFFNIILFYFTKFIGRFYSLASFNRFLLSLIFFAYWVFIIAIYTLNWISNAEWGSNIVFEFVKTIPRQVESILILLGLSKLLLFVVILVVLIAIFFCARYLMARYIDDVVNKIKISFIIHASNLLVVLYSLAFFYINFDPEFPGNKSGEPILHLFSYKMEYKEDLTRLLEASKDVEQRNRIKKQMLGYSPKTNVVLIIVDSLRADHMGLFGYSRETTPFLTELYKTSSFLKVDHATSTCSESACGILSTLSSRPYKYIGYNIYKLNEVLKDVGYQVNYFLSSSHQLNHLVDLYGKDIDRYIDGNLFPNGMSMFGDDGIVSILKDLKPYQSGGYFFYLHLMSAHLLSPDEVAFQAYTPAISFIKRLSYSGSADEKSMLEVNAYDNGVLQADSYIKTIIELLTKKGYLNDSLIIITSDHGEGLGERGHYKHTEYLYQEDINIPLLFLSSHAERLPDKVSYATHIDIAPTVLDYLSIDIPATWKGISLLNGSKDIRFSFHQTLRNNPEVSIIAYSHLYYLKLMATMEGGRLNNLRFFDLQNDSDEKINIYNLKYQEMQDIMYAKLRHEFLEN